MLYVVGGGLAGLAAAVAATRNGCPVTLFEATNHPGGRCRSYVDTKLGTLIDNGTHLLLNANRNALSFAHAIGGQGALTQGPARFPFVDLASGRRWCLTPWSLMKHPLDLARALGAVPPSGRATVAEVLGNSAQYHRLWDPLSVATLNTASDRASARQFARMLRVALPMGLSALKPWTFPQGLSAALVDPAMSWLTSAGALIRFNARVRGLSDQAITLDGETIGLGPDDRVILALPHWSAREFLPDLPDLSCEAIVNGHFRLSAPPAFPTGLTWMGAVGGLSQWISLRGDVVSVTISAANAVMDWDNDRLAQTIWTEVAPLLGQNPTPLPPARIIRERRATLAHTPDQVALRPGPKCAGTKITLAGDWLDSPLPCTIEAAVTSGLNAAAIALGLSRLRFTS